VRYWFIETKQRDRTDDLNEPTIASLERVTRAPQPGQKKQTGVIEDETNSREEPEYRRGKQGKIRSDTGHVFSPSYALLNTARRKPGNQKTVTTRDIPTVQAFRFAPFFISQKEIYYV